MRHHVRDSLLAVGRWRIILYNRVSLSCVVKLTVGHSRVGNLRPALLLPIGFSFCFKPFVVAIRFSGSHHPEWPPWLKYRSLLQQ